MSDDGSRALLEFTSGEEPGRRFVLFCRDLGRLAGLYSALLVVGLILTAAYLVGGDAMDLSEGARMLWESGASLCGCAVYGIRRLYRLGYGFEMKPLEAAELEAAQIRRWGALAYFYSRAFVVPTISLFALVLIKCGLLSAFSSAGGSAGGGLLMLGISFLLGLSGGVLVNRLIDLGCSGVGGAVAVETACFSFAGAPRPRQGVAIWFARKQGHLPAVL